LPISAVISHQQQRAPQKDTVDASPLSAMTAVQDSRCFCDAFSNLLTPTQKGDDLGAADPASFAGAPVLPMSTDMISMLAADIHKVSNSDEKQCAVAGVCGPIIAAMLGAAAGNGMPDALCARLRVTVRRELRALARLFGASIASQVTSSQAQSEQGRSNADAFNVVLAWAASPIVPTYDAGLHLALGLPGGQVESLACDLAWVFRLLGMRTGIRLERVAPVLTMAAEALCSGKYAQKKLNEALDKADHFARRDSLPERALEKNIDEMVRVHSTPKCSLPDN